MTRVHRCLAAQALGENLRNGSSCCLRNGTSMFSTHGALIRASWDQKGSQSLRRAAAPCDRCTMTARRMSVCPIRRLQYVNVCVECSVLLHITPVSLSGRVITAELCKSWTQTFTTYQHHDKHNKPTVCLRSRACPIVRGFDLRWANGTFCSTPYSCNEL